jgi:hypothetical protein
VIILKWFVEEIGWEGMFLINVMQDREQWRSLVNAETHLCIDDGVADFLAS